MLRGEGRRAWRCEPPPPLWGRELGGRPVTDLPFDPDAVIDAMAPLLGLAVKETSRVPVKTHLEIAARYAALLEEADIGDLEEPAPVYTA
jgi:hypothetical protein